MNKGAKENWFQSPHVRNGMWFNYEQKTDLFNFSKHSSQQRFTFLTPSRNSKPIEMQKGLKPYYGNSNQAETNRFEDINLPDMFSNTLVGGQVINEKIDFQESSVISEQNDCYTPSKQNEFDHEACDKSSKELPKTAVKERHEYFHQEKKTRPKQKGLRMLSQKAYQIVTKMNGATYKQVANKLVDELALEDTLEINGKDQQNIKRRVYDALNVLIALGILKKDGRKIYGLKNESQSEVVRRQEMQRLTLETKAKQFRILEKLKVFRNTKIRAQMIRALIKRNSQSLHKTNKIQFPFIAICVKQEDEVAFINIQKNATLKNDSIQIKCSQKKIQPFGDMDTIQFLSQSLKLFVQ